MRTRLPALMTMVFLATPLAGQAPRKLGTPTAKLEQEFSGVEVLRELKDGRVLLVDAREKAVHLLDVKSGTDTKLGREGDGPGEFRFITRAHWIGGDSIGLSDMARAGRLLILRANGELGGLMGMIDSSLSTTTFYPMASDKSGRLYVQHTRNLFVDSTVIVRWDRAARKRDSVARYMATPVSPLFKEAPEVRCVPNGSCSYRPGPIMPFATANQWAVAEDGRIAIVEAQPYRVTLIALDGKRVTGPTQTFVAVPVGDSEKEEFLKSLEEAQPMVSFNGRGNPPTYGYRKLPSMDGMTPQAWPPTKQAFAYNAPVFASDGMLWVKRNTKAGAPAFYDVFDGAAKLAYQIELPAGRKLLGFGSGSVYLARVDDDGLHYLEKYALPATRPVRP